MITFRIICKGVLDPGNIFQEVSWPEWLRETAYDTVEKEINQRCKLTEFVILDFSEIFYSEKPIMKVNILMTGTIHPSFTILN